MQRINKEMLSIISIYLTIAGILIWLFLILTTRIWWVDPKYELGLYQAIPIYFWLALLLHLAGTLIGIKNNNGYMFFFQIIILNLMVWGTPIFIEPYARNLDAWQWFGTSRTIIESGHIVINNNPTHYYLRWPGSFIFNAVSLKVTSSNFLLYLQFYPLFTSTLFIFFYYLWIRKLVKDVVIRRYTVVLFIFLNLWLQFHFSAQAFGLMLFPLILIAMGKKGFAWRTALVILIITLIISHPTTTLFLLMIIICQEFVKIIMGIKIGNGNKSNLKRKVPTLSIVIITVCTIIIITFLLLFSRDYARLFETEKAMNLLSSTLASRAQRLSSMIRLTFLLSALFAVLLAIIHLRRYNKKFFIFSVGWFMGCIIPLFWDFTMAGAYFHDRSLMFAYMLIPLLVVESIWRLKKTKHKHIVMIFIMIMSIVSVSTLYAFENDYIVSDSRISTTVYLIDTNDNQTIYGSHLNTIWLYEPEAKNKGLYQSTSHGEELPSDSLLVIDEYTLSLDTPTGNHMRWYIQTTDMTHFDKVYSNNHLIIYVVRSD